MQRTRASVTALRDRRAGPIEGCRVSAVPDEQARRFSVSLLGYDRQEVDDFHREASATTARLRAHVAELERRINEHERSKPITAEQAFAQVGRETQRVLQAAQDAAARIVAQAREEAEREVTGARREHSQIVGEGYRARDTMSEQLAQLDQARALLVQRLYDATAAVERTVAMLESDRPATPAARQAVPEQLVERQTGTEVGRRRSGEATLRIVEDASGSESSARLDRDARQPLHAWRPDERGARDDGTPLGTSRRDGRRGGPVSTPAEDGTSGSDTDVARLTFKLERLAGLRDPLVDILRRQLDAVRDDIRERLRRSTDDNDAAVAPFDETVLAGVAEAGRKPLVEAFALGAAVAASADDAPAVAVDIELGDELLVELDTRIGAPVRTVIAHSAAEEDPPWVVAERVEAIFADASAAMVAEITQTELSRAYERGMLATWSQERVTARRWVVGPQGHRRDQRCRRNTEAGPVVLDEAFPSGDQQPPRFGGCTCTTAANEEEHDT